jgi:hypothetical protein
LQMVAMFVNGLRPNEHYLERTFHQQIKNILPSIIFYEESKFHFIKYPFWTIPPSKFYTITTHSWFYIMSFQNYS